MKHDNLNSKLFLASVLALFSILVWLLQYLPACSQKKRVVVKDDQLCGEYQEGSVREGSCADGELGKVFEICKAGAWEETSNTCEEPGGDDAGDDDSGDPSDCGIIYEDIKPLLTANCLGCHFTPEKYDEYGVAKRRFDGFLERIQLPVDNLERMPKDPKPPLTDEQIDLLKDWDENGRRQTCGTPTNGGGVDSFGLEDVEAAILSDLSSLDADDRKNSRYLITSHKYNLGDSEEDRERYRQAIDKMTNSLNLRGDDTARAQEIAPSIFRIDLRSYNLDGHDWQLIELKDRFDMESFTDRGQTIKFLTGARKPWLHFDVFINTTTSAQVYYDILRIPHHLNDFLRVVGVDIEEQILDFSAFFIGGFGSPISINKNRLIVRYEGNDDFPFTWITYDPIDIDGADDRNLFQFPLLDGTVGTGTRVFNFAASETITMSDTGLVFALWSNAGIRQDEAPIEIVQDTSDGRFVNPEINNSIDCFRCHQGGFIPMEDQIREHVSLNASQFDSADADAVLELYKPAGGNVAIFQSDSSEYNKIAEKLGFDLLKDPVTYANDKLVLYWGLEEVAAFFLRDNLEQFKEDLARSSSGRAEVGQLLSGGAISLNQFLNVLQDLKIELRIFEEDL